MILITLMWSGISHEKRLYHNEQNAKNKFIELGKKHSMIPPSLVDVAGSMNFAELVREIDDFNEYTNRELIWAEIEPEDEHPELNKQPSFVI